MSIPTGSGTEVLKRNSIPNQTNAWSEFDWTAEQTAAGNTSNSAVPTNHIITVISIIIVNMNAAVRSINSKISASGRTDIPVFQAQSIAPYETFVFSDRIVLHPGDKLGFYANNTNMNVYVSYIQQNWS